MRSRERETNVEEGILETKILIDCITDNMFEAFEVRGSMPPPSTMERIMTLQLILQRRSRDLYREFHGFDHEESQK